MLVGASGVRRKLAGIRSGNEIIHGKTGLYNYKHM
jgi:hypothetical protein